MTAYFITFFITFLYSKYRIKYVMTHNNTRKAQNTISKNPLKCAIIKKIRTSEEVRIFLLVGVSGFEPGIVMRKTIETQGFFYFVTFFHYILCRQ